MRLVTTDRPPHGRDQLRQARKLVGGGRLPTEREGERWREIHTS
jgi:hypothetical protein